MLVEDIDDLDDFLTQINVSFMLLCEHFHTEIDFAEFEKSIEAHKKIDEMEESVSKAVLNGKASLAYEEKIMSMTQNPHTEEDA